MLLYIKNPLYSITAGNLNEGPAKGIFTTSENKIHYDNLYSLLQALADGSKKTIFISGVATWAYIAFPNLTCSAPTTWRIFCDDERLKIYYEDFPKKDFPDCVLILDQNTPSNDRIENNEENIRETWMFAKLKEKGFEKQEYPSGTLYSHF